MAKRKRKKKSIGVQLKYEVYGILLITISIIALSGEAAVGRALSKLFGLALGKFYFVLALVGVYIGLTVMIKRAWPKGWTSRKTGLLVLVLAFTLSSAISEINERFEVVPKEQWSGGLIFSELDKGLKQELISLDAPKTSIRDKQISGGYIGAVQYSALFSLFGYYGALLIMLVMFAISFMLLTGRSYVDMLRIVVKKAIRIYKLFEAKQMQWAKKRATVKKANAYQLAASKQEEEKMEDDDYDDNAGDSTLREEKRKKLLFFSWKSVTGRAEAKYAGMEQSEQDEELEHQHAARNSYPQQDNESDHTDETDNNPPWNVDHRSQENDAAIIEHNPLVDEDQKAYDYHDSYADNNGYSAAEQAKSDADAESGDIPAVDSSDENSNLHNLHDSEAIVTAAQMIEGLPRRPIAADEQHAPQTAPYMLPPFSLLNKPSGGSAGSEASDLFDSRRKLEATLESFGVRAKVLDVVRGPAVTRYEVQPATGVKVSRIVGLTDDIALALAAKDVRMEAPIPGKSAIGIEVPNMEVSIVTMREVMETAAFQNAPSKLSIAFGRDISGQTIVGNLAKMPHLLVAGATGSGKSVCINGIITSILYKAAPDEVKFLMIDPKMVELNVYNGIPHLLAPVVTNPRRASLALKKIVVEMEKRYELFSKSGTRNIEGYNALMADNPAAILPYIVVIVDELADLMMVAANDVEDSIARLAQMARAAGIHLIIATQRPSVDVITGVIKANIPSRIAFGVSSQVDSRTILDMAGAEKLLGRGDMLFLPVGMSKPIRVQGAFLSDQEVEALVSFTCDQAEAEYKEDLVPEIEEETEGEVELDELYSQAVQIVVEAKQASVSLLQRRMRIGYTRAARLIDQMEAKGIVGPYEGSKPREVLMTQEQFQAN